MVHFLVALILLLVTSPFVLELSYGRVIESLLITLVLLTAMLAVGGRRRTLIVASALVAPAVVSTWLWHLRPDLVAREIALAAAIAFVIFVIVHLLRFILCAPRVNFEVLCAGVSTYLMMGLLWSITYTLVSRLIPHAFKLPGPDADRPLAGFEALYFSFSTLSSVGYGDIVPVANAARMLAMLEATSGTFYIALLIARLVALYTRKEAAPAGPPSGQELLDSPTAERSAQAGPFEDSVRAT
jgi:hypothetical protein